MLQDRSPSLFATLAVKLGDAEAFVALLLSAFVFLVLIGICGGIMLAQEWARFSTLMRIGTASGYGALMICEVRSLGWITHGLQMKRSPRAVWLAMSLRDHGVALNSVLAGWWVLHLAAILTAGIMLDAAISSLGQKAGGDATTSLVAQFAGILTLFMATYMSSSFLVLAVGSVCRREEVLQKIWRTRALIDATVVVGIVLIRHRF